MSRTLRSPMVRGSTVLLGLGVLLWLLLRAPVSAPHHGLQAYAPFQVLARHLQEPSGLARDPVTGHLFVAEADTGLILRIHFDEHGHAHLSTFATGFTRPRGLAWDAQDGSLLVVDEKAESLSRITQQGKVSILRKDLEKPQGVAVGEDGTIYVSAEEGVGFKLRDREEGVLLSFTPDGSHPQLLVRGLKRPAGVRALPDGRIRFLADRLRSESERAGGTVFEYGPDDDLDVLVREGFKRPHDLSLDALDATYLTADRQEDGGEWRPEKGVIGKAFDEAGVALFAAGLQEPRGLLFDAEGNLYVAEAEAGRILKFIAPSSPTLDTQPPPMTKEATLTLTGRTEPNAVLTVRGATVPLPPQDDVSAQVALRTSHASSDDRRGRLIHRVTLTNTGDTPLAGPLAIVLSNIKPSEVTLANATGTTTEGDPYLEVPLLGGLLRPGERVPATLRFDGPHRHRVRFTSKIWALRPTAVSDATGHFSFPVTLTPNTKNNLELFATTHLGIGLTSPPTKLTVIHDDKPPTVRIAQPGDRAILSAASTLVQGTVEDATLETVKVNGVTATVEKDQFQAIVPLAEGENILTATATDRAGNTGVAQVHVIRAMLQPTITRFTPTSGRVGGVVTLTGTNLGGTSSVAFAGTQASVLSSAPTQVITRVPSGARTGPLTVTTGTGSTTSTGHFVVLPTQDFTLVVQPPTVTAIAGTNVSVKVSTVATGGYAGLIQLSTGSLPPGVTATFTPPVLGPNASGTLTLTTSGSTPGSSSIEVRGVATLDGTATVRTILATLNVQAPGQTVLTGQVRDQDEKPLAGVSIKLGGSTITSLVTTDAGGNFLVPLSVAGPQVFLIDGSTANTSTVTYPTIPVTVNIQPGVVNTFGYIPHLLPQPRGKTVPIQPAQETILAPAEVPGLQVRIPAGVTITGWDGQPNTEIGVVAVPVDRSGAPPIPVGQFSKTIYAYTFGKVGGGTPSQPVPIFYPNDVEALPGEQVDLHYYDEAPDGSRPNAWVKYGTGTVSPDGSQVLPDTDPATGKPYGVPRFCCGYNRISRRFPLADVNRGPYDAPVKANDPVELQTGLFVMEKTDLVLPGIIPLVVTRTYRTNTSSPGPFGLGTSWNYDLFLLPPPNGSPDQLLLIMPGGSANPFARQPDGSYANTISPIFRGAQVTVEPGLRTLRFKDGTTWRFRSADGLLDSQTDRNGNTLAISRDGQGRATALTEPMGRSLTVSYLGTSILVDRIRDPLGREVRYSYDAQGRLETVTDPAGGITQYTYDSQHRMLTLTDARGITFLTNEYDAQGRVIRQAQADGGIFTFDYTVTSGFITATKATDPRGNATTYRFNNFGYLISQTDALGQTTTFERQPGTNLLLATIDPIVRVTRFSYDASGNVTGITDPLGNTRTITYDSTFNKVTSITDPLGNVTTFEYDTQGNLIAITDPEQNRKPGAERLRTKITYNEVGQPLTTTDALGNTTTFAYDNLGNLTAITDPLGNTTIRTYDDVSRLLAQTDPLGRTTRLTYDPMNRITTILDALGGGTSFSYDPNGNMLAVTDARGNTITHEYDSMDRLVRRFDQLGRAETFTYDGNGNLVTTTDRKLQTAAFSYDAVNRRIQASYADGTVTRFEYDAAGRLIRADDTADPHRPITLAYDALNRILSETTSLGTASYDYDALGRRTQMTVSGQALVLYYYDAASRLRTITQSPLDPVTLDYDALGRRTLLTLPNGVSTEYQYNAGSQLTALLYRSSLGFLGDLSYQYDATGNRTAIGGSFARTLLADAVPSATYDAANRQLAFGVRSMLFDANGSIGDLTEGGRTTIYVWDPRGHLIAIDSPGVSASFGYDATGRRNRKTVNGQTTIIQYDGLDIVRDVANDAEVSYLANLEIDEQLVRVEPSGTFQYLADALGSTLALTDGTGKIAQTYSYAPFGQSEFADTPASPNPFQFAGRENDGTGLYYYRARYYSPALHRFISEDPIRLDGGVNFYAYVGGDPISRADPTGEGFDIALDIGFIGYDIYRLATGGRKQFGENVTALGLDIGAAMLPFVTGAGAAYRGARGLSKAARGGTEVVQRSMSRAELEATRSTGLIRGGKPGPHFVTDAVNSDPLRARQRLALPQTPEVRVTLEVPDGTFSSPTKVRPDHGMPGGGTERVATGNIPVRILRTDP